MKTLLNVWILVVLLHASLPCYAMISVGYLSKEEAAKVGIVMKQHPNGDAGVKVWLEFKKEGFLEKFTYAELLMEDTKGKHVVSARLEPHPMANGQAKELVSVAFSADPAHLSNCSFMVVAYGSSRGDVGYVLKVKDFFDLKAVAK